MTIDWSQAGQSATSNFDKDVQKAAGAIVLAIDDLMADASVPRQLKLLILQQLGVVISNRQQLEQLLAGQVVQGGAAAIGGGAAASTPAGFVSQTTYDTLKSEKDQADTQNQGLLVDRGYLEQIVLGLGLTHPTTNNPFPTDIVQRVEAKVQEKITDAISGAGLVQKAAIKAKIDEIKSAWSTARPAKTSSDKTVIELPQNKTKIDDGITAIDSLVS